jgi:hypothetical protein
MEGKAGQHKPHDTGLVFRSGKTITVRGEPFDKLRRALSNRFFLIKQAFDKALLSLSKGSGRTVYV